MKNKLIYAVFLGSLAMLANCSSSDDIPSDPVKLASKFYRAAENGDCTWIVMYQKEVQKRHPKSDLAVTTEKCQERLKRNGWGPDSKKSPMKGIGIEKSEITGDHAEIQMSVVRTDNTADSHHLSINKEDGMWVAEF